MSGRHRRATPWQGAPLILGAAAVTLILGALICYAGLGFWLGWWF